MNARGNENIGNMTRYDSETRDKISKLIKAEWKENRTLHPSAEEFAQYMMPILTKAGVKSPDGGQLTLRGVKYQVQRTGIVFKGRVARSKVEPSVKTIPFVRPKPAPVETTKDRVQMVASMAGIPKALQGVLEDETLNSDQRKAMFRAYFELNR